MKLFAILALCFALFATDAEAARGKGKVGGGSNGGDGSSGGGGGIPTNCGYGCLPIGGTVCVDPNSLRSDGSYLAISPSTPSTYIGQRVVLKSEVRMLTVIKCWAIQ